LSSEPQDTSPAGKDLNRRDFLKRLGYASAAALGACGLGLVLYDPQAPPAQVGRQQLTGLGDYRLRPGTEPGKMAIVHGSDRGLMVARGVQALGGMGAFVQKGDRVLLKVNAAFATPPSLGATTNPETLAAVARLCYQAGAARVVVTDNPINNPNSSFEISGLAQSARQAGSRVILPRPRMFAPVSLPGGRLLTNWPVLAGVFTGINKVIVVSQVKDHRRAGASLNLKNIYGFLGGHRNVFHQDINGIITELSQLLRPTLCVLDGTVSMMTNGPTGGSLSDLKQTHTMIAGTDPVAADAFGATLLGKSPVELPYIGKAEAAGVGRADYRVLKPVEVSL
jgi:uncharacterized protein (DUF362 family)